MYPKSPFFRKLIFILPLLLFACSSQKPVADTPTATSARKPTPTAQTLEVVTITGWFTIVWNGEPHYSITDDHGQSTQLLIDEEITRPLGGALELNGKRVAIVAEPTNDPHAAIRVLSIRLEENQ